MSIIFSSGRTALSNSDWDITSTASLTSNLSASTYYFSLQGRNRVGLNLPIYKDITITSGRNIIISIYATAFKQGENWKDLIISYSSSTNPQTFRQILAIPFKLNGSETLSFNLPIEVELDSLSALEATVLANTTFNDSSYLNGKIVYINSLSNFYEFNNVDNPSLYFADGTNLFTTNNGIYRRRDSNLTGLTDIDDYKGCNIDVRSDLTTLDIVSLPIYTLDGSASEKLRFSIYNNTNTVLTQNTLILIDAFINNTESTSLLENSIIVKYIGYCNNTTGELRTVDTLTGDPIEDIGLDITYSVFSSNLFLPNDLQIGESFILEIYLTLNPVNYGNLFNDNSGLFIYPSIQTNYTLFNPFYTLFKKAVIIKSLNELFIQPLVTGNVEVKSGEVIYDGYSTSRNFAEEFYINDEETRDLVLDNTGTIITATEGNLSGYKSVRIATIKKEIGYSKVSQPQNVTITANQAIVVDLSVGIDGNNQIPVRTNYANTFISGKKLNPFLLLGVVFIVTPDTTIYKLPFVLENTGTETVTIDSLTGLDTVVELNLVDDFGLIDSPVINSATATSGGNLTAGSYSVYLGYEYTGEQITDVLNTLPVFDLEVLFSSVGSGTGNAIFNKTTIVSLVNNVLDFRNNTVIDLFVTQNCTLATPNPLIDGATITLILRNNNSTNVVTFDSYFIFETTFPSITLTPNSFVVIKLEIYTSFALSYIVFQKEGQSSGDNAIFGNDFQLNNDNQLTN